MHFYPLWIAKWRPPSRNCSFLARMAEAEPVGKAMSFGNFDCGELQGD